MTEHDGHTHDDGNDDQVDPKLQSEFDELLNISIDVAQQQLEEQGGFVPFAVALTTDGEAQVLMLDEEEHVDGESVVEALLEELGENRQRLIGAAVVSDVLLDDDQDAIRVDLEHSDTTTEAMVMALQYTASDSAYEFGELLGSVGERQIWT